MTSVLLTHSAPATSYACLLAESLGKHGYKVSPLNRDTLTVDELTASVSCNDIHYVFLLAGEFRNDPWVGFEAGLAAGLGKKVQFLLFGATSLEGEGIPAPLADITQLSLWQFSETPALLKTEANLFVAEYDFPSESLVAVA